ncbi:Glucooligosaccharide oxidase [Lophiostoma macrostomum CBS 122681]|uniref:Glucooligosaccharide oxidase n=1 Tax=Lophiostoma macrostomum CBS 122681 TaxID=1314788 RepID=A0A6A6T1K7_9PLEO|nr:Glucooligosaccharide oxidase [Lophiostoma macrostomum CBS 122681]
MKLFILSAGLFAAGLANASLAGIKREQVLVSNCLSNKNVPTQWKNSSEYNTLAEPFNTRLVYEPYAIVLPETNQHVQDAVACAAECGIKVQAKSGGHSYASFSSGGKDGSLMIFLQAFNNVTLNQETGIVSVGGGVRLGNLANGIYDQGKRALPHGTCPGVGVGGHATHGGYGHVSREYGLALDTIVGLDIVLANGSLVHATETEYADVYWACRGACDSIGIVTKFEMQTHAAPESITYFDFEYSTGIYKDKDTYIETFLHIQDVALNTTVVDERISWGIYENGSLYKIGGAFHGTIDDFKATVVPEFLRTLPTPNVINITSYSWIDYLKLVSDRNAIIEPLTGYDEHDDFFAKSITVPEKDGFTAAALGAKYDYITTGKVPSFFVITNLYGGPGSAINEKDTEFAAYRDRDSLWVLQLYGNKPGNTSLPFINGLTAAITGAQPQTEFGAYLNYVDPSLSADEAHKLYYGEELYGELQKVKEEVDPDEVFWNPQAVVVSA